MKYKIRLTLLEPMLATVPSDQQIYTKYIVGNKRKEDKVPLDEDLAAAEVAMITDDDKGTTVFRNDGKGLIMLDYQLRGFIKAAAEAVSGVWGVRSKIDKWVFVEPRVIPIMRDGKQITESEAILSRPLRAMTMQGPRVAISSSEVVNPGATMDFTVLVFPLAESKMKLNGELLKEWFEYGGFQGLGQWRSGSYGRFSAEVTPA